MSKIGLIFDSSYKIGGGHFWRCLNLAKSLDNSKNDFYFISNDLKKNLIDLLKNEKFKYIKNKKLNNAPSLITTINKLNLDILITDYYKLNSIHKKKIKKHVKSLIVIDDYLHKKHFCDVYINNNFISKTSKKKIKKLNPNTKLFLGPQYPILDKKFVKTNDIKKRKKIKKIFAFFGSSDPSSETIKFVKAIKGFKKKQFIILIGKLNQDYQRIKRYCKYINNIKLFYNLPNKQVYSLLKKTDLAVGSGGVNLLERLFIGLPSFVICTSANQKDSIKNIKKKGLIKFLGNSKKVSIKTIKNSIKKLVDDRKEFIMFSNRVFSYFSEHKNVSLLSKKLSLIIDKSEII